MSSMELYDHDQIIFNEMMTHPVLFTHQLPQKIALINPLNDGILQEILKHSTVKEVHLVQKLPLNGLDDPRVFVEAFNCLMPQTFDVVIHAHETHFDALPDYFRLLKSEGLLMQQSNSFFKMDLMTEHMRQLKNHGFNDFNILHFPQSMGMRSAIMAIKQGNFKRLSEKIIYNKSFSTDYYNFDIHQAAMVLPEFVQRKNAKLLENDS